MRGRGCDPTKSGPAKLNLSSSAVLWSFEIDSEKTTRSRSRSRRTVSATHCLKSFTKKDGQTPAGLASLPILARRGPIRVKGLMTPSLARRRRKLRVSGSPGCGPTPLRAAVVSVPPGRATPCPRVGPRLALRRFHASLSRGMTRSASLATSSSSKHSTIESFENVLNLKMFVEDVCSLPGHWTAENASPSGGGSPCLAAGTPSSTGGHWRAM